MRGVRIEPGEVQAALARCDGVGQALVRVRDDDRGDRYLAAYVVPSPGATVDPAAVRLPGGRRGSADSVEFRGEPIVYAHTIPLGAPHPETALAFARFVLSPAGRDILVKAGFRVLERPLVTGSGEPDMLLP